MSDDGPEAFDYGYGITHLILGDWRSHYGRIDDHTPESRLLGPRTNDLDHPPVVYTDQIAAVRALGNYLCLDEGAARRRRIQALFDRYAEDPNPWSIETVGLPRYVLADRAIPQIPKAYFPAVEPIYLTEVLRAIPLPSPINTWTIDDPPDLTWSWRDTVLILLILAGAIAAFVLVYIERSPL